MKRILLFLGLIILLCVSVPSQKLQNKKFIGVFRSCLIHCSTYKIKADFTFEYTAKGDMFNITREGTWQYVDKDKIHLFAPGRRYEPDTLILKQNDGTEIEAFDLPKPDILTINKTSIIKNEKLCIMEEDGEILFCFPRVKSKNE
ncbi:MAG TPA: hypothetical protein VGC76_20010 [Pyrinomonadaceae bacterium]|jgi:hypothetical protein